MVQIERVEGVATIVGESPIWDPVSGSLWFVDILGSRVHRLAPDRIVQSWDTPSSPGAVALTADHRVAMALEDGFCVFDPETERFSPVVPAGCHPDARISEGKVDRQGRLVATSGDRSFRDPVGALHRWEGPVSVGLLGDDLILGNGVCWNLDGSVLYVADSLRDVIYAHDYEATERGGIGARRVFYSADGEDGFPDGATVDSEDHVWTVLHRSPWIVRLTPEGSVDRRIRMPTGNICSLTFGGADLDELYVTSLDPRRIPGAPGGGAHDGEQERGLLYRVTGVGARGVAEPAATSWVGTS